MYVVRDVFRCKPGQAKEIARRFRAAFEALEAAGEPGSGRILVDAVADYWTVVLESEVADLAEFERQMAAWGKVPAVAEIMRGYMDLVDGGRREIFRVVA